MSLKPFFDIVLACSRSGGIGKSGKLPWKLSKETKYFMNLTKKTVDKQKKNVLIMGRKTWEDQDQPFPNRISIVVSNTLKTQDLQQKFQNVYVAQSFDDALNLIQSELSSVYENVFFIGGTQLYSEAVKHPSCRIFHITRLSKDFDCDAFLPKGYLDNFVHLETSNTQSENDTSYVFSQYLNKDFKGQFIKHKNAYAKQHEEFQYLDLIKDVIANGSEKSDRTGTGIVGKFGHLMRFDLSQSFPLLTTKKVFFRGVAEELLWFIKGSTNSNILSEKKIGIWDGNGSRQFLDNLGFKNREQGDLGPVYGFQWRHFGANYIDMQTNYQGQGVDQLQELIKTIKENPNSRRMLMNAWNVKDLHLMALPPCHVLSQYYVDTKGKLSCMMYQRSCDLGLGIPFNIASYSLLTCMIAHVCGLQRGEFVHVLGDYHVYKNHIDALKIQLERVPNPFPIMKINRKIDSIDDFKYEDFELIGYDPLSQLKMKMAV